MTQIDIEDFFYHMCWKFKNLTFGPNSYGIAYNFSYLKYGMSTLDSIKDRVNTRPTMWVWVLIACLDPLSSLYHTILVSLHHLIFS
jgi:hypothetical protein